MNKLTKFQQKALGEIETKDWAEPRELISVFIRRREFVAETLFKKGYLERRVNPKYSLTGHAEIRNAVWRDDYYQYKLKS